MTYEAHLQRLDDIVAALDGSELPLADALRLFEEGVQLLRGAAEQLAVAEARVRLLAERADGTLELRPVDD